MLDSEASLSNHPPVELRYNPRSVTTASGAFTVMALPDGGVISARAPGAATISTDCVTVNAPKFALSRMVRMPPAAVTLSAVWMLRQGLERIQPTPAFESVPETETKVWVVAARAGIASSRQVSSAQAAADRMRPADESSFFILILSVGVVLDKKGGQGIFALLAGRNMTRVRVGGFLRVCYGRALYHQRPSPVNSVSPRSSSQR